jgi:hypothetical protein
VDLKGGVLVLESLKKRKRGVYRAVPVPCVCVYDFPGASFDD